MEAGLPNISGSIYSSGTTTESTMFGDGYTMKASGALYLGRYFSSYSMVGVGSLYNNPGGIYFDASKSNSIYGKSSTVTPPSVTVRYYIRAE